MKTSAVRKLVQEALDSLSRPYTEDVIDDVMFAVEHNEHWRRRYDVVCAELGKTVANNWCSYWIANALGKAGERTVSAKKSTLIGTYSILDSAAIPPGRKPKEPEALKTMSDYYRAHRAEFAPSIVNHREAIMELLMEGMSAERAFAIVLKNIG